MANKQTSDFTITEDKLVLAVAPIKIVDKICYVYSLICPKDKNSFILDPKVEIYTTKDAEVATMHYGATKQMAEYQKKAFKDVYDILQQRIDMFYQHTK